MRSVLKNSYIKVDCSVFLKDKWQSNSFRCVFYIIYNETQHDGKVRLCELMMLFIYSLSKLNIVARPFQYPP